MSELFNIFLTAGLTVIGGIALLVLGELIKRAFIDPINEQARLIVEISEALVYYANISANPIMIQPPRTTLTELTPEEKRAAEASDTYRRLAARLLARNLAIPWYSLWQKIGFGPKREHVIKAHQRLIGLSNSTPPRDSEWGVRNAEWSDEIEQLLRLRPTKRQKSKS